MTPQQGERTFTAVEIRARADRRQSDADSLSGMESYVVASIDPPVMRKAAETDAAMLRYSAKLIEWLTDENGEHNAKAIAQSMLDQDAKLAALLISLTAAAEREQELETDRDHWRTACEMAEGQLRESAEREAAKDREIERLNGEVTRYQDHWRINLSALTEAQSTIARLREDVRLGAELTKHREAEVARLTAERDELRERISAKCDEFRKYASDAWKAATKAARLEAGGAAFFELQTEQKAYAHAADVLAALGLSDAPHPAEPK